MDLREGDGEARKEVARETAIVRRQRLGRTIGMFLAGLVGLLLMALFGLWLARKPIAENLVAREFERRGVRASYQLDRIGLRTQQISNLVIGDPARPDLTAKSAQVEMRILVDGGVEVFRIAARGVRLRGRLVGDRVTWGEVDKLLPKPTVPATPFRFPNVAVDLDDAAIALSTVYGPLGFAVEGRGNLTGGFKGRVAAASPGLTFGACRVERPRASFDVAIVARRPHLTGPAATPAFVCPASRLALTNARLDLDSDFSEAFGSFDGKGKLFSQSLIAGTNGLANLIADIGFKGTPQNVSGGVSVAAQQARLATILADATRFTGRYNLAARGGRLSVVGDYDARNAKLAPSVAASLSAPLAVAAKSPVGPLTNAIAASLTRTAAGFNAAGRLRLVNFPGGGGVRVESANAAAPTGERIRVAGRDGVTYYWPSGKVRVDSRIATGGGGLPNGWIDLRQPRGGGPAKGEAQFAPYAAGGARLTLAPVVFTGARDGSTRLTTTALLDGPFKGGSVTGLRVPIDGSLGGPGGLSFGAACLDTRFQALSVGALRLGPARVPLCPLDRPIIIKRPGGALQLGAQTGQLALAGQLGNSSARIFATRARLLGVDRFDANGVGLLLGNPDAPVRIEAQQLDGRIGKTLTGTFSGGNGVIGKVPLAISDARGKWSFAKALTVDGALTVSDRSEKMKFRPLASDNVHLVLAANRITTTGTLRNPASGTPVSEVEIEHNLAAGQGHANLDVAALRFSPSGLQPDDLTTLTEGVIALVDGTIRGRGRIDWAGANVTSTGDFSTDATNLAAAFGPVTGIAGTIHFTDLLNFETAPDESIQLATVNTGILVENGVLRYQLLPGQLVRIERGEWPFMGGRLVLRETILNLGKPTPKRLTFEVVGLDAKLLVDSFGFKEIAATGVFDGVLPMIFDENGGRIVGGRLDSRDPGGSLAWQGVMNKANLGLFGSLAFDALRDLRFNSMIVRLDGDLAGEFASRLTIDRVVLGNTSTQRFLKSVNKIPFKFNVSIKGPFRALIGVAKSFNDPRATIRDALPEPIANLPDDAVIITNVDDTQQQTQTPVKDQVTRTPKNER